ncbi:fasciclin domain-containing protein [Vulcanococcus limneticus]|uniref:fasciclin domain-containing protein n=1 Tax=Vulcanococcus limneticus TaxID=2170428 RepID=UPI000B984FBF|nr:fasciclin domain-containing protein [Vulcanococcus limneticus]MCP9790524.1 fasciclin domain-containing protein [Vulcanococcus limneticus MW73D5]MCP9892603.1 fasciclin domain-containing protein [Vulcanococcus limneticus Candia 3F8]MCP9896131.1 fasciclin domain-containing protein [Vulcanococcus limneticus Candia 3B3]
MANIIETAKGAGCFGTLLTAVEVAGLTGALEGPGPFTVFAPVDDAFAALPPGTVQTLVDNPPQLGRILKFHVLSGAYSREVLVTQPEWESLEGAPVAIRRADPFEVKNATVVSADIVCDNGIVHVIDRVILPG